ncbi:MAG: class I SAM-dependent methyltransferase [Halioglobus sp.]|nr:class I SAM-dependent methyltransferase [Halioglobus sp.]
MDLVADAHDLHMVENDSVDFVTSASVLEHVTYPQQVVKEIHRILKPGGIVYINVPFIFPFHADPGDFYRFTHKGIDILCEDFEKVGEWIQQGSCFNNASLVGALYRNAFLFQQQSPLWHQCRLVEMAAVLGEIPGQVSGKLQYGVCDTYRDF